MSDTKLAEALRRSFARAEGINPDNLTGFSNLPHDEKEKWILVACAFRGESTRMGTVL